MRRKDADRLASSVKNAPYILTGWLSVVLLLAVVGAAAVAALPASAAKPRSWPAALQRAYARRT
jgi:hypothetical protein